MCDQGVCGQRGVSVVRRVSSQGCGHGECGQEGIWSGDVVGGESQTPPPPPPAKWLMPRSVRILLECFLVYKIDV